MAEHLGASEIGELIATSHVRAEAHGDVDHAITGHEVGRVVEQRVTERVTRPDAELEIGSTPSTPSPMAFSTPVKSGSGPARR